MQVTPKGAVGKPFDGRKYIEYIRSASKEAEFKAVEQQLADLTARELYEADGLIGGWHTEIPRGVVRFALSSWTAKQQLKLRQSVINMLVDGFVLFYRFNERNREPRIEDPHIIDSIEIDDVTGDVQDVVIEYKTDEVNPSTKKPVWLRLHYWQDAVLDEVTGERVTEWWLESARYEEGATADQIAAVTEQSKLDYWPYVAVQWIDTEGILSPVKTPILRYESACISIAVDNDRHSNRKRTYEGVSEVETVPGQEYEVIPAGSKTYYVDTHPSGLDPMFREQEVLETRIRHTVGYIRVEKLHNISGIARLLELRPMLSVANAVREKCREMYRRVYGDDAAVFFPALIPVDSQDREIEYRNLKEMLADGVITDDEFMETSRLLRDLPPLSTKDLREMKNKRDQQEKLNKVMADLQALQEVPDDNPDV